MSSYSHWIKAIIIDLLPHSNRLIMPSLLVILQSSRHTAIMGLKYAII